MEQPQEETPEAREEEKEEVAMAEGAPELNGGPEQALPSSSCTGMEKARGRAGGGGSGGVGGVVQVSVNSLGCPEAEGPWEITALPETYSNGR